jgi:nucleotide-binding universal stress UspA family protein
MLRSKERLSDCLNVLMPVDSSEHAHRMLPLALALLGKEARSSVNLLGITPIGPDASLSEGTLPAQQLRNDLDRLADKHPKVSRLAASRVTYQPWHDIEALIEGRMNDEDLLLLPWQSGSAYLSADLTEVLNDPPCNVVVAHPSIHPRDIKRILLPVRGGQFASLGLQLAIRMARALNAEVTLLRVLPSDDDLTSQMLREEFTNISDAFPEITRELQVVGDASREILRELKDHQAVILGASAARDASPIGLVATLILQRNDITTLIVETKEPFRLPSSPDARAELPLLVRVEKWFAENTFHHREFADVGRLIDLKRKSGMTISLGLPAFNDEATIGELILSIKGALMDDAPLLDEVVLIDGNSTDGTRTIAHELGVKSHIHQQSLTGLGSSRGKGEALWKSLYLLKGDLIAWIDTDIVNPHPRFVYGILGPLLVDSQIKYVKGFYRRAASATDSHRSVGGGRVTELLARPMINLFFPELSGLVQPLAGMYAGRRSALEQVPFYTGYGVEAGLLLDLLGRFRLGSIAQADLEDVRHRNQDLLASSKRAFAILQVFAQHLRRKGMIDAHAQMERTMKILRAEEDHFSLEEVDVYEQQRPPMIEMRVYRGRHARMQQHEKPG